MADIRLLKKNIFELIAAGEVVNNPCSIVKELVENSIDANSSHISIEIKNGGKTLIRVIDNGIGIKNKQCRLAFLNHATSKIFNEDDLNKIKTLGFRGEALSSIAAVSKVLILTKTKEENLGSRYIVEGGEEKDFELVSCSNGTIIEVKDIFFNTPARLKFLKTDSKETSLIQDIIEKLALSNSLISFDFKKDGKKSLQTYKTNNKKDTIYYIYGKEFYDGLIDLNFEDENIKIEGFISDTNHYKSYRSIQYIFINSRYVKSKSIVNIVEESFKGSIPALKYPSFILYLHIPLDNVDVNIHPNKTEVRFFKEQEILNKIGYVVRKAIFKKNNSFFFEKNLEDEKIDKIHYEESFEFNSSLNPYKNSNKQSEEDFLKEFKYLSTANIKKIPKQKNLTNEQKNFMDSIVLEENVAIDEGKNNKKKLFEKMETKIKFNVNELRIIGEIFKLYILAEFGDEFIIIDKHAAHERILYEKLKNDDRENLERQILINPIKVLLGSNEDCEIALKNKNLFLKFGFLIEHFEGHFILIRETPLILANENCVEVFEEMLSKIKGKKNNITPEKLDELYATLSCKAAIKRNQINTIVELKNLAEKVYFNPKIRNCPHSRPVIFVFKKERFDKKFGRK